MFSKLLRLLLVPLPQAFKKKIYTKIWGWEIHNSASIGFSYIDVKHLVMERGSSIGNFNVLKGLSTVSINESSSIGSLNWFTGFPIDEVSEHFSLDPLRDPSLHLGSQSAITSRHIIDCTDSFRIGNFSTFAGFRSQVLTHSIDLNEARQRCSSIVIGDYCFIGTGSILLPGVKIHDYCIIAAGSVVSKPIETSFVLAGGTPAKIIKEVPRSTKYFTRNSGYIW